MVYPTCAVIGLGGWDEIRHRLKRMHSALLHVDVWSHLSGSSAISGIGYMFSPVNLFYLMPDNDSYFWCYVLCNWPQVPCLSLSFPLWGVSYVLCPSVVNLGGPLDAYTPLSSYPRYCFPFLLQIPLKKNGTTNIVVTEVNFPSLRTFTPTPQNPRSASKLSKTLWMWGG